TLSVFRQAGGDGIHVSAAAIPAAPASTTAVVTDTTTVRKRISSSPLWRVRSPDAAMQHTCRVGVAGGVDRPYWTDETTWAFDRPGWRAALRRVPLAPDIRGGKRMASRCGRPLSSPAHVGFGARGRSSSDGDGHGCRRQERMYRS